MIAWNDKYSVDISFIDEQHKKIFELINSESMVEIFSNNSKNVLVILDKMTEYAFKHFEIEERYMKEFNFPGYELHRNEHTDFIKTTIDFKNRVVGGDYKITNEILEYLLKWLVNHIQVTDKKYIDCFKKNGLK